MTGLRIVSTHPQEFIDEDLDKAELGGRLHWIPPPEPHLDRVLKYKVYLAEDRRGQGRHIVFHDKAQHAPVPKGRNLLDLSANTPLQNFSQLLVFTESVLGEQTVPTSWELRDTVSPVTGVH